MKIGFAWRPALMAACAAIVFFAAGGCRREDPRQTVLEIPGLNETNESAVVEALSVFEGVDVRSIRFDHAAKTVSLAYDSMKVAKTNLRDAIEEKGVKVAWPQNTRGVAGYINTRQ